MNNINNKMQDLKNKQIYYNRKFFEMSQEIVDIADTTVEITNAVNEINIRLLKISETIAELTKTKKYSKKRDIVFEVIMNLREGAKYTIDNIMQEFHLTKQEAKYVVRQVYFCEPSIPKTVNGQKLLLQYK